MGNGGNVVTELYALFETSELKRTVLSVLHTFTELPLTCRGSHEMIALPSTFTGRTVTMQTVPTTNDILKPATQMKSYSPCLAQHDILKGVFQWCPSGLLAMNISLKDLVHGTQA